MTILNGGWAIRYAGTPPADLGAGAVDDVELLVIGAIRSVAPPDLSDADFMLTMSELLGRIAVGTDSSPALIDKFEHRPGILFRPWLYRELQGDAIDFWRSFHGRKGEKRVADSRPGAALRDAGFDDGDLGLDRPHGAPGGGADGIVGDRAFPGAWVDLQGDSELFATAAVGGLRGVEGEADPGGNGRGGVDPGGRDERPAAGPDPVALDGLEVAA